MPQNHAPKEDDFLKMADDSILLRRRTLYPAELRRPVKKCRIFKVFWPFRSGWPIQFSANRYPDFALIYERFASHLSLQSGDRYIFYYLFCSNSYPFFQALWSDMLTLGLGGGRSIQLSYGGIFQCVLYPLAAGLSTKTLEKVVKPSCKQVSEGI